MLHCTRTQCNGLLLGSGIWQTAGLRASCWFGATLWEAMFGATMHNYFWWENEKKLSNTRTPEAAQS